MEEVEREHKVDIDKMKRRMKTLSPLQVAAVNTYAQDSASLKSIGETFGVSREWVNQTRKRVVRDLRLSLRVTEA
jgi:DNA-directed RNA polymerase specialized sigma subunit